MEKLQTQEVLTVRFHTTASLYGEFQELIFNGYLTLHTDKFLLTKEQIIKLVGDAFEAGSQFYEELVDSANYGDKINAPDQETYIDNLFK